MPEPPKRAMPKFTPAPPELVALFQDAIRPLPEVEPKTMFGYPAAFVAGQMFACIFGDGVMLRLSGPDRAAMGEMHGAGLFEPVPGRPMKEYVRIPPSVLNDESALDGWLRKSMAYARSLPPKKKKKKG
jgi:TfoX/Sxy family transcriptional regulator of competence genes